jgi:hypothetical protein
VGLIEASQADCSSRNHPAPLGIYIYIYIYFFFFSSGGPSPLSSFVVRKPNLINYINEDTPGSMIPASPSSQKMSVKPFASQDISLPSVHQRLQYSATK